MITDIKKKEIISVKELMDLYTKNVDEIKTEIDNIDEKYRKLAEKEKKELKEALADCKSNQKKWEKIFKDFDSTLVTEALGKDFVTTQTEVPAEVKETDSSVPEDLPVEKEEEKVVDTIFPENNEEKSEPENVPESVSEPEFDGAGFIKEDNEPESKPETKEQKDINDIWPDEKESESTGEAADDGWPDMPQGW